MEWTVPDPGDPFHSQVDGYGEVYPGKGAQSEILVPQGEYGFTQNRHESGRGQISVPSPSFHSFHGKYSYTFI